MDELLPTFTIHTPQRWDEIGSRTAAVLPDHLAGKDPVFVVQYADGKTDDHLTIFEWDGVNLTPADEETANAVAQMFWNRAR